MTKQEFVKTLGKKIAQTGNYYLIENRGTLEIHNVGQAFDFDAEDNLVYLDGVYEAAFVGCIAHRENFETIVAETQAEAMAAIREAGF